MMTASHVSVLREEVLAHLRPAPGRRIVDATYGFGGHASDCLERGAEVLGLDLDDEAVAACRQARVTHPHLQCRKASFRRLDTVLRDIGWGPVDGVLLDLGVSSPQLDDPDKGFTYRADTVLDLRFDRQEGEPAHALLARLTEAELASVLHRFGEERHSRRLAHAIMEARAREPLRTTGQLRRVVEEALPPRAPRMATLSRVYQALRILTNGELDALQDVLALAPELVKAGGRIVVIAYHSLEDRIVKHWLDTESRDCICPPGLPACRCGHQRRLRVLTRKAVRPLAQEQEANPRARSARLRAGEILARSERKAP